MNHLVVAPILLPALVAALSLLSLRRPLFIGRTVSIGSALALIAVSLVLLVQTSDGTIFVYALGNWPAPFGIVLVADRLAALMLLLTSLLALIVLWHVSVTALDRRGWHFHPLVQFQLLGLNGAFLTGDLFNLFVFFEVLLIASYGLMLHGQGAQRLTAGVQYVIINLVGSTLFLLGLGILYGVTGTLNMADMAVRIAAIPDGDRGLLQGGAILLFAVFALKAALLPFHLWLPRTYARTSPPVAALFAIMTKVGVYAIIRVSTLIFGTGAGDAWSPGDWMLAAALVTTVIGFLGVMAAPSLRELAAFALIGSTGTLLAAVALFAQGPLAAALYYLPHTTLAAAALFLVTDLLESRSPRSPAGRIVVSAPSGGAALSVLFILAAIAIVGLPPLSGFVGKLLILERALVSPAAPWVWSVVLITTLVGIIGFARAGSRLFWKSAAQAVSDTGKSASGWGELMPSAALLGLLLALTLFAGQAVGYTEAVAAQLFLPGDYIRAVLGNGTTG